MNLVDTIRRSTAKDVTTNLENNGETISELLNFSIWIGAAGFLGLFTGFLVSLLISLKRHWFWFNAVLSFLLAFIFYKYGLLGTIYIANYFMTAKLFLKNIFLEYAIWGGLLLVVGIFTLFSKRSAKFISHEKALL